MTTERFFCVSSLGALFQRQHPDFRITTKGEFYEDRTVEATWHNAKRVPCSIRVETKAGCTQKNQAHYKGLLYIAVAKMIREDSIADNRQYAGG